MKEFDTSKLENTGWRFFRDQMKEWYRHEFKELSQEYKDNAIDYVIEHNAEIFTRDFVLRQNLCHMCGLCCREIGCPDHNPKTNRCTKHDNQNSKMCSEYPWSEVGMIFSYNCGYQRDIVKIYMDMYFKKAIELMRGKNEKKEVE
ncbi:MAG: hypothetical protein J6B87_07490 [Clostridia bacterium]|nr:hypothetical protein [Clostridia bacterium]